MFPEVREQGQALGHLQQPLGRWAPGGPPTLTPGCRLMWDTLVLPVGGCGGLRDRGARARAEAGGQRGLPGCPPHHQGTPARRAGPGRAGPGGGAAALQTNTDFPVFFSRFLFSEQAHAKVWHTYDTQWRGKQRGKQRRRRRRRCCCGWKPDVAVCVQACLGSP